MYDVVPIATTPDLLRLVALPVFAWAAVRDIKTRRVTSSVWIPLAILGAMVLVWDGWVAWNRGAIFWSEAFLLPAAISFGFVVPLAYLFWWFGGFGGADAKALLVLALLFPTFPAYSVGSWVFPLTTTPIGAFSFTILTNTVILGICFPIALAIRNAAAGRFTPAMLVGWPTAVEAIPTTHGRLLETPHGRTRSGLDLDALRMYLRWRGLTLADLRAEPDRFRDPKTLPETPNPPTDGAVTADVQTDGGSLEGSDESGEPGSTLEGSEPHESDGADSDPEDPWGAATFLESIEGTAYGTSPTQLREGLEVVSRAETVWVSPGTPFLVPVFLGLVVAFVYGDLLLGVLF